MKYTYILDFKNLEIEKKILTMKYWQFYIGKFIALILPFLEIRWETILGTNITVMA